MKPLVELFPYRFAPGAILDLVHQSVTEPFVQTTGGVEPREGGQVGPRIGNVIAEFEIVAYSVVDDFGTIVNPNLLRGQVHGGIVQGIGQAVTENCVFDDASGQLMSGSLMDYCLPRADDIPALAIDLREDAPCKTNPLGIKGSGEAGAVGAPPAVVNAIVDALSEFGVDHIYMPVTREKIWRSFSGSLP